MALYRFGDVLLRQPQALALHSFPRRRRAYGPSFQLLFSQLLFSGFLRGQPESSTCRPVFNHTSRNQSAPYSNLKDQRDTTVSHCQLPYPIRKKITPLLSTVSHRLVYSHSTTITATVAVMEPVRFTRTPFRVFRISLPEYLSNPTPSEPQTSQSGQRRLLPVDSSDQQLPYRHTDSPSRDIIPDRSNRRTYRATDSGIALPTPSRY